MSEFIIKPATRQGIIPLLGLWGGTGGGKTESALRLARGIAGSTGKIAIIDTEGRRASYYVDRIPGSFFSIDFEGPFNPERYIEALDLLEKSCDVGVLDSATHCWEGPDGILDLHEQMLDKMCRDKADDYRERERLNWPAWREPKQRWKPLRSRILAFKKPLIVCFRGEAKTHMEKDPSTGRNTVVTDVTTSPIFDRKFIFEMHVAMEVFQKDGRGGFVRFPMPFAKTSHADIRALLPEAEKQQITIEHGVALAAWCAGASKTVPAAAAPTTPPPASQPAIPNQGVSEKLDKMFAELQEFPKELLKAYAEQNGILMPMEHLDQWPEGRIPKTVGEMRTLRANIKKFKEGN